MRTEWAIFLCFLKVVTAQDANCDFYQSVDVNRTYYIYSPNWPASYTGNVTCRWIAACPTGYNCRVDCPDVNLPDTPGCTMDGLLISRSADPSLTNPDTYCGRGSLSFTSTGQQISLGLVTGLKTPGGRFTCDLTAQPVTPGSSCSCGVRRQNRIVGGTPTGINEYPMMAGLVRRQEAQIRCGGVIISNWYILTAAHCVQGEKVADTIVVVGEHDVTTGDSTATRAYAVESFTIHPLYDESSFDYDIALLKVSGNIQFSDRVLPVCLPFKYANESFAGKKVTVLGWGTTEPGGPLSKVPLKADLDVISQTECRDSYNTLTSRQMCTFTKGKDACQYDSGGPVLYTDPTTGLLFSAGIISNGRLCASGYPGINTRITEFLQWIVANAPSDYCIK